MNIPRPASPVPARNGHRFMAVTRQGQDLPGAPKVRLDDHLSSTEGFQPRRSAAALLPQLTTNDGAFTEPRGGKRWQLVANPKRSKTAETSENRCRCVATACRVERNGKERGGRFVESVR